MKNLVAAIITTIGIASAAGAITGGTSAAAGQFPSTVFFGSPVNCTATKIAPRMFITAAHCLSGTYLAGEAQLKMTTRDLSTVQERFRGVSIKIPAAILKGTVAKVHMHPSWIRIIHQNEEFESQMGNEALSDVGIIELKTDTVEIPTARVSFDSLAEGQNVLIAGYGQKIDTQYDSTPLTTSTTYGSALTFGSLYKMMEFGQFFVLPSKLEAKEKAVYALPGDSGGPAFIKTKDGALALAGIISWGKPVDLGISKSPTEVGLMTRLDSQAGKPKVKTWLCSVVALSNCR